MDSASEICTCDYKDVIYVRHNLDLPEADLRALWVEPRIALDYSGSRIGGQPASSDPNDYSSRAAKSAFRLLRKIQEGGALVSLYCRALEKDKICVGVVRPGSQVVPQELSGHVLKTLKLHDAKQFSLSDFPVIGALHPQQNTICQWRIGEVHIRALYSGLPLENSVMSLMPGQLEVLVFHYLLRKGRLRGLLMPIGRALIDVDIVGLGPRDDSLVFVQVTHHKDPVRIQVKWNAMKTREKRGDCLLAAGGLCPDGVPKEAFLSIEEIYDQAQRDEELRPIIDAMHRHTGRTLGTAF